MSIVHNVLPALELRTGLGLGQGPQLGLGEHRADGDTVDNCGSLSLTMGKAPGTLPGVAVRLSPYHGLGLVLGLRLGTRLVGRVLVAERCGWCLFHQRIFIPAPTVVCLVHFPGFLYSDSKDWTIVQSVSMSVFSRPDQARRDRSEALLTRGEVGPWMTTGLEAWR